MKKLRHCQSMHTPGLLGTLVFCCQRSRRNSYGAMVTSKFNRDTNTCGYVKIGDFRL